MKTCIFALLVALMPSQWSFADGQETWKCICTQAEKTEWELSISIEFGSEAGGHLGYYPSKEDCKSEKNAMPTCNGHMAERSYFCTQGPGSWELHQVAVYTSGARYREGWVAQHLTGVGQYTNPRVGDYPGTEEGKIDCRSETGNHYK